MKSNASVFDTDWRQGAGGRGGISGVVKGNGYDF